MKNIHPDDIDIPKRILHKTIKKISNDIVEFRFNTAISQLMIFVNTIRERSIETDSLGRKTGIVGYTIMENKDLEAFLKLVAPFAPHITEELWANLGHKKSIHLEKWPEYDEKLVVDEVISVGVQVNGKHRATITLPAKATEQEAREIAEKDENVRKYLDNNKIIKFIYVPGKIINFVTE